MKVKRVGVRAAVLDGKLVPGDVEVADGLIHAICVSPPGGAGIAIPGYIDLQVNGFAGVAFLLIPSPPFVSVLLTGASKRVLPGGVNRRRAMPRNVPNN